jgi:hypothetical protein
MSNPGSGRGPDLDGGSEHLARLAWRSLWTPSSPYYLPAMILSGVSAAGGTAAPLGPLSIASIPHVALTQTPLGEVGIGFTNLAISGLATLSPTQADPAYTAGPGGRATLSASLALGPVLVTGDYQLTASGPARRALDTAGALTVAPGAAGGHGAAGDTRAPYLDAARQQRARLWQTPGGGQLMDQFYENNEAYAALYANDTVLQELWTQNDNLVYQAQTYGATQAGGESVNRQSPNAQLSYNANAFAQKSYLYTACVLNGNTQAADAVVNFQGNVQGTGNTATSTVAMTVDEVYSTISTQAGAGADFRSAPAVEFTEFELERMEEYRRLRREHDARATGSPAPAILAAGACSLRIDAAAVTLDAGLDFGATPPAVTVTALTVDFDPPILAIANLSAWEAGELREAGRTIVEAFHRARFLGDYLHDRIQDALESRPVADYLAAALGRALARAAAAPEHGG